MLLLFETPAGFALFKVLKEDKLEDVESLGDYFNDLGKAKKVVKLKAFSKFDNTTDALSAATALVDSKIPKSLKKFLKKHALGETLAVMDAKLGNLIKEKLAIDCTSGSAVLELARGVRTQLSGLIESLSGADLKPMSLGLSHSMSRYKLKFSPDKVDTMVVQAIGLLDDLDKELNTYAMRVREWYGWHFPEMTKIVSDNVQYAKAVKLMGMRTNAASTDFSAVAMEEQVESVLKEASVVSMGTEISEDDLLNIKDLCEQVIVLSEYRGQLYDYLKSRMAALAPNLTVLVGELVGARLIAHAGTLINLAKQPASTVQILGAEKALFRALKTKQQTPKYGLIYHASLIGQASAKHKGKISRLLAAKCALAIRVDALGEGVDAALGTEARAFVDQRLRQLEGRELETAAIAPVTATPKKYEKAVGQAEGYGADTDVVVDGSAKRKKKRKADDEGANGAKTDGVAAAVADEETKEKQKKKKRRAEEEGAAEDADGVAAAAGGSAKKAKKKKQPDTDVGEESPAVPKSDKKKKKSRGT